MEIEPKPSNMESWKSQIQVIEESIQWLKQAFNRVVVKDHMQTLADLSQKVYGFGAPKINRGRHKIHKSQAPNWCEARSDT